MLLAGKTALITGASGGLGVVETLTLAREGADVLMLDVKGESVLGEIEARLPAGSGKLRFVACDLADTRGAQALARRLDGEVGGIDILVNNAAINPLKPIDTYDLAEWEQVQASTPPPPSPLAQAWCRR